MEFKNKIPTSKIEEIVNNPEARRNLLVQLGYELVDLDLWEGWLFLEESSAEKIIRENLIPWFTPSLQGKIRTFSAGGVDGVEPKFDDFNTLFKYLNLQPTYRNKAWVIIDEGDKEKEITQKLKTTYKGKGWSEDHFMQFDEHDFEKYYPQDFEEKVKQVLSITDREKRRSEKKALLDEVESWIRTNPEIAKNAFEKSAANIIDKLKSIEAEMNNQGT
jgi:hypothetical protein